MLPITAHPRIVSIVARQQHRERVNEEKRRRAARSLRTPPEASPRPSTTSLTGPRGSRRWFLLHLRRSSG